MNVTVSGITKQMADEGAWIARYKKGRAHTEFGEYYYLEQGTNYFTFDTHIVNGDWELRLFRRGTYVDEDILSIVKFTIGN